MPRPSEFIKQVRHYGWRSADLSYDRPVELNFHDLEMAARGGKQRDAIIAQLCEHSTNTGDLVRAKLPAPRTRTNGQHLHGSIFVRIAIWHRPSYDQNHNRLLQALVHAEYALHAPVDLDPDELRFNALYASL